MTLMFKALLISVLIFSVSNKRALVKTTAEVMERNINEKNKKQNEEDNFFVNNGC